MKISNVFEKTRLIFSILYFLTQGFFFVAYANNIQVSNVVVRGGNVSAGVNNAANFCLVQFNLSWENSWRTSTNAAPFNWDAAWVFVKFQVGTTDPTYTNVTLTNGSPNVTLSAGVTNLRVGMPVRVTSGSSTIAAGTVITAINTTTNVVTLSASAGTTSAGNNLQFSRIWEHAFLNSTGHTAPTGSTIDAGLLFPSSLFDVITNPALGVFIYRSTAGSGTNSFTRIRLRWNYGANGINDDVKVSVQVFAIEMVYVPGGVDFNVGGGGGSPAFTSTTINTANVTTVPSGTGTKGGQAGGYPTGQVAPTANWPNGYNAFYCMKYEISQGQYRDFLNTLTRNQQIRRVQRDISFGQTTINTRYVMDNTTAVSARNAIRIDGIINANSPITFYCDFNENGTGNEAADGEWIACNFLSWMDGCAYMDWAGLRPMTELEFEKACRGDQMPVLDEKVWGAADVQNGYYNLSNAGQSSEDISSGFDITRGNAQYYQTSGNINGPVRVGIFAANASNTGRVTSGASYYGIMELSGNLRERAVTIGNVPGRSFTGLHGNGTLYRDGSANVDFWPGINGNASTSTANTAFSTAGVTQAAGSGFRSGGFRQGIALSTVSDRSDAAGTIATRSQDYGFRGVRSSL
jgi:formylglycine-generating enzyme required for sulfatase activity